MYRYYTRNTLYSVSLFHFEDSLEFVFMELEGGGGVRM